MHLVKLLGGLGNQMFQYAFAKTLEDKNVLFFGDYHKNNFRKVELGYFNCKVNYLPNILYKLIKKFKKFKKYEDLRSGFYNENIIENKNKESCIFIGYFQTEKYFKHLRAELLQDFEPKQELDPQNSLIAKDIKNTNSVSIHIRRSDYLTESNKKIYGDTDINYYKRAIKYISDRVENIKLFFFSDDMEWVKQTFSDLPFEKRFIDINTGDDSYKDLVLMKNCKHNIIPNSTFAWWGAWLNRNPNKIVIAPKIWFYNPNMVDKDIIPEDWIRL